MPLLKNMKAAVSLLVVVLLIFSWWWIAADIKKETARLRSDLREFIVPPIEFNGRSYAVKNGRVFFEEKEQPLLISVLILRMAHASVLSRLDPIFGIEGTDPELLAESVRSLERSKAEIAASYNKTDRRDLEAVLYPVAFLRLLAETETERQRLTTMPSVRGAYRYYQRARAMTDEALRYISQAERLYSTFPKDMEYYFLGGKSTSDMYVAALAHLYAEFSERKRELNRRAQCAFHFSPDCPTISAAFQALDRKKAVRTASQDTVAPPEIFEYEAVLHSASTKIIPTPKEILTEVIVRVAPSTCEKNTEDAPYYRVQTLRDASGLNYGMALAYLNDIYFYDLSKQDHAYFKLLKESGGTYLYQPIENFYMCPDAGSQYTTLATLLALRDTLKDAPLAAPVLGKDAEDLEFRITQANTVTDADIDEYLGILSGFLVQNGERELAERMGDTWVFSAESLLSIYRARSGYFNALVGFVRIRNEYIKRSADVGTPISLQGIFLTRNPFLLFLLAYNKSAVSKAPQLMEPVPFNSGARWLTSYTDELRHIYSLEEAAALIIEGKRIEARMVMNAARERGASSAQ